MTADMRAVVARVDFHSCVLLTSPSEAPIEATVRGSLMGRSKSLGSTLVVGDLARFEWNTGRAVVTGVEPRRNAFTRRGAAKRAIAQVVAANLDQVVLVAAIVDPPFRPGLADRVLCQAEHSGVPARLALNKIDLAPRDDVRGVVDDYSRAGYPVHAVSARTGEGLETLLEECRGRRSLFIGHSGVGKSTLLNALVPGLELLAAQVNPKTGKGRHTTTAAWLLHADNGVELIDTPGVRTFALWGVHARDLERCYPEFRPFLGACRFADCLHDREPDCAIRTAVESGRIAHRRHQSFLKLRRELELEPAGT